MSLEKQGRKGEWRVVVATAGKGGPFYDPAPTFSDVNSQSILIRASGRV